MSDDTEIGHGDDGEQHDGGHDPVDPLQLARHLHEERRYLGSGEPVWHELPEDVRDFAVAMIVALLDWLHDEGTEIDEP